MRECFNAFEGIIIYKPFIPYLIYYTYGFEQSIRYSIEYKLLLNIFLIDKYSCLTNTKESYPDLGQAVPALPRAGYARLLSRSHGS